MYCSYCKKLNKQSKLRGLFEYPICEKCFKNKFDEDYIIYITYLRDNRLLKCKKG